MMRIGMILDNEFPPDIRIEKEAKTLIKRGYEIYLLCRKFRNEKIDEIFNDINIKRFYINSFISKFTYIINCFIFYNPLWGKIISDFIDSYRIDILHIHDLPLAGTGIKIARKKKIPVIIDLHENHPAALRVWNELKKGLKGFIIRDVLYNYKRWMKFEGMACKRADRIITVVEEMKDQIKEKYGIDENKIFVVTNTEDRSFINNANLDYSIISEYNNQFIISYIGGFGPHRGLDTVIKGISFIKKDIQNILLLLIGKGDMIIETYLKELIKKLKLEENVKIIGWQPFNKVYTYIYLSDICIVPHKKNEHTEHTVPHKLFQYMMVGKPIIVSDCKTLKRIVEEIGCGLVFSAGNPYSFAEKVLEIYKSPNLGKDLGEKGREATLNGIWNWEETGKILIELYKDFLKI